MHSQNHEIRNREVLHTQDKQQKIQLHKKLRTRKKTREQTQTKALAILTPTKKPGVTSGG